MSKRLGGVIGCKYQIQKHTRKTHGSPQSTRLQRPDRLSIYGSRNSDIWNEKIGTFKTTRFSVSIENEQADKRRDSQTCLAKPNSQARTGARKIFPVQLTMNRIGNLTQLICTLLYVMTTHTCIRIYCSVYPQFPPVIGAPWGCCGHVSTIYFPVRYGSVGV